MKNNKFLLYAVIVIAFVIFNIVVFQLPINKTEVFWWSYGFSCISYIVLLIIFHNVFCIEEEIKSRFLGFPIVYIGILYFFIQLVFFSVTLFYQNIPKWIVIIVNTLLLGLTMILISFTQIGKNYVKSIDEKNQDEVLFTKGVVMKLEVLKKKFHQEEKNRLEKLIEVVKYSDPMSNGKCQEVESQIMNKLYILENSDDKLAVMEEMENLFEERNQKIKLWK